MKITKLEMEGFRSFRKATWEPGDLNVVIGPNGSGKSNLLRVMEIISISARGKLAGRVQSWGGMEPLVWDGDAPSIKFAVDTAPENADSGPGRYELEMARLGRGSAYRIEREILLHFPAPEEEGGKKPVKFLERTPGRAVIFDENQHAVDISREFIPEDESLLSMASGPFVHNRRIPPFRKNLADITVCHDLSVGPNAPLRRPAVSRMEKRTDPDGRNLISVIHTLYTGDRDFKKEMDFAMNAAFGDDFEELIFPPAADQRIQMRLRWKSLKREHSAADLSDGTLRFLFLLTVLAAPSPPPVIAIDEPETGLHPSMFPIVAEYPAAAAEKSQVILTTHSPTFLDAFTETIPATTVTKWENGQTVLGAPKGEELEYWLKEYSMGALFKSGELERME